MTRNDIAYKCNSTAYGILTDLDYFNFLGIPPYYEELYKLGEKMLIDNLTSNINNTISFIKTLNLNNRIDSLIMSYVDSIKENLKTQKEKDDFTQFISSLEDKFPNSPYINWNCLRFYKAISSHDKFIVSLKDSDNSEDDEN